MNFIEKVDCMITTYNHHTGSGLHTGGVFALPDGHLAGNANGSFPTGGVYELFARSGIPIRNGRGGYLGPKNDGNTAYIEGFEALGPVQVVRPQPLPKFIRQGTCHAGIFGSDCAFDAYAKGGDSVFGKDGKPNPALLDVDGHEQVVRDFLKKHQIEFILGLPVRKSFAGFAFPREYGVETIEDMRRFPEYHLQEWGRDDASLATEYERYARAVLSAYNMPGFRFEHSEGSTENLMRHRVDGVMEIVETGSGLLKVDAKLVFPVISLHYPVLAVCEHAPDDAKELAYAVGKKLAAGLNTMRKENPDAFRIKLDYSKVGWDSKGFKLPEPLDRMRG